MDNYNPNQFRYNYNEISRPILDAEVLLNNIGRPEGLHLEPRTLFLKIGSVSNVKGSAYMEYGNTKVMAQVDPPKEIVTAGGVSEVMGVINCSVKYAPVIYDDPDVIIQKENYMSLTLKKALEPVICLHEFINLQLDISVTILDDDGCALSTAINCCGIALVAGGISLYDMIVASTICFLNQSEYVNPSADVEEAVSLSIKMEDRDDYTNEHGMITISTFSNDQITQCSQQGFMRLETLERLCTNAITVNRRLHSIIQQVILKRVKFELALERCKRQKCLDYEKEIIDSK